MNNTHGKRAAALMSLAAACLLAASMCAQQTGQNDRSAASKRFSLSKDHPLKLVSAHPDPVYKDMLGLRTNGWLGSDDGESIVLSKTKILWLFGDTFIGPLSNGVRVAGAPMINSTIGIQDRAKSPPDCMTFYWKTNGGKPASFFPHQAHTPGDYYWVTKGVMLKGELFLFAWCIKKGETHGGEAQGLLNWSIAGTALIRVPNPLDPPERWEQKAFTLEVGDEKNMISALLLEEPWLYLYGIVKPRQTAVARIRTEDLIAGKLSEAYEYWVNSPNGPRWSKEPVSCVPQFMPVNSECTVYYEPAWKLYLSFTYEVFDPYIFLTTAEKPTGPWSKPEPVYSPPEQTRFSYRVMTYAARQHPELSSRPGEVILTYASNTPDTEAPLFTPEGKDIYVHRFVRLQLEPNKDRK